MTALEPGELILELDAPPAGVERVPEGDGPDAVRFRPGRRRRARRQGEVRVALAGAAPIPWLLGSPDDLDQATPLPGTAYKVDLARPLIRRALDAVA